MKADKGSGPLCLHEEDLKHVQLNCTETSNWRNEYKMNGHE